MPRNPVTPAETVTPVKTSATPVKTPTASPRKGIVGRAHRGQDPSFSTAVPEGGYATLGEAASGLFDFVTNPIGKSVEVVTGDTPMGHLASVLGIDISDFSITDAIGDLFGGGDSAPSPGGSSTGGIPGTTTAGHSVASAPSAAAPTAAPTSMGTASTGGPGPGPAGGAPSGPTGGAAAAAANAASGVAGYRRGSRRGRGCGRLGDRRLFHHHRPRRAARRAG